MTAHRSHRLTRALAAGLTAAALLAPPAFARPLDVPHDAIRSDPGPTLAADPEPVPARAPVVRQIDAGFDWDSAAIGAGALIALASLGGLTYTARRRVRVPA
jgi:hypothetical protein